MADLVKEGVDNYEKIGRETGLTTAEVAVIKNTVAKGTTDTELSFFLMTAKLVGLSPFNKEIWCYKDNRGNLIVFAGRDGFLKKAQMDSRWNGIVSSEVREKDEFSIDFPSGKVHHIVNPLKERGLIVGAYAITRPKDVEITTVEYVDFKTYNKGEFTWRSHPAAMIKKVAEVNALKKAYGITGLQSEHEFLIHGDVAIPIQTERKERTTEEKEDHRITEFIQNAESLEQLEQVEPFLKEHHKPIYEQKKLEL